MTRKHFKAIAAAIASARRDTFENPSVEASAAARIGASMAVSSIILELAAVCAAENPNFDRLRFIEACGGQ